MATPQYAMATPHFWLLLLDFLKFLLYSIFYPRPGLFLKYARFEKFFKNFFLNG